MGATSDRVAFSGQRSAIGRQLREAPEARACDIGRVKGWIQYALFAATILFALIPVMCAQSQHAYLGMDRNEYPGDTVMKTLRNTFEFTGYWLNNPPGANENTWLGKRKTLDDMGYGFLLLFNGREYAQLKALGDAARVGANDAAAAVQAAERDGFPKRAIIFLDQEQGGRMLPEQRAYIHA
jgi:hypothetical protein